MEIWIEKDAVLGSVEPVTDEFGVPLLSARGFSSLSFSWEAAKRFKWNTRRGKRCYLYHFGDWDPSGQTAARAIGKTLGEMGCEVSFIQAALTQQQIEIFNLPERPTKASTHDAGWTGGSVELDALSPDRLRWMVEEMCIGKHLTRDELERVQEVQEEERAAISRLVNAWNEREED